MSLPTTRLAFRRVAASAQAQQSRSFARSAISFNNEASTSSSTSNASPSGSARDAEQAGYVQAEGSQSSSSERVDSRRSASVSKQVAYPDLLAPDAAFGNLVLPPSSLIPRTTLRPSYPGQPLPPLHAPQHKQINHPERLFPTIDNVETSGLIPELLNANGEQAKLDVLEAMTGLSGGEIKGLNRYTVVLKRVVNMTKKGKM